MSTTQFPVLKPGDEMNFRNGQGTPIRIRVTTHCGTLTEVELHPGAVFRFKAGTQLARIEILPASETYTGLKAVD